MNYNSEAIKSYCLSSGVGRKYLSRTKAVARLVSFVLLLLHTAIKSIFSGAKFADSAPLNSRREQTRIAAAVIIFLLAAGVQTASAEWSYTNGVVYFWNNTNDSANIPQLYSTIWAVRHDLFTYNATTKIYTMYVPFYQNDSTQQFKFNETVHLQSVKTNCPSAVYFRFNNTLFDGANVTGWNTTTNAPENQSNDSICRSYIYSDNATNSSGFVNSTFKYLGFNGSSVYNFGVTVTGFQNRTINNNTVDWVWGGLYLTYAASDSSTTGIITLNNTISHNIFSNSSRHGLYLHENSSQNTVSDNIARDNANYGYTMFRGHSNTYLNNTALNNNAGGFHLVYASITSEADTDNILNNNTIYLNSSNTYGIYIDSGATNNSFTNSSIIGLSSATGTTGVYFNNASTNIIQNISIINTTSNGIFVDLNSASNQFINISILNSSTTAVLVNSSNNTFMSNFTITPFSGALINVTSSLNTTYPYNFSLTSTDMLNFTVLIRVWNTSGDYHKVWTQSGATAVDYLGDFPANTRILVNKDGTYWETVMSNNTGYIAFTVAAGDPLFDASIAPALTGGGAPVPYTTSTTEPSPVSTVSTVSSSPSQNGFWPSWLSWNGFILWLTGLLGGGTQTSPVSSINVQCDNNEANVGGNCIQIPPVVVNSVESCDNGTGIVIGGKCALKQTNPSPETTETNCDNNGVDVGGRCVSNPFVRQILTK